MIRHRLRDDGAGFYQLAAREYSFSAIKIRICTCGEKHNDEIIVALC
ncbi:DUF2575 domain-containing protein [Enterobacteriaceae bacterium 4M9]|nr:DUF2575 domain-containing protein [Enterobacteriaceae bacterium 4M9]